MPDIRHSVTDARRNIETVLIVGTHLSRIRKAVEDPACGYEGKTWKNRYSAAIKVEILDTERARHLRDLSRIRKAVEDPACGYEGKSSDNRYNAAIKAEIYGRVHAPAPNIRTLYDYRTITETFNERRNQVIAANVSQRKLLEFAKADDAEHLYGERGWTMQRIGEALGVSKKTISLDLNGVVTSGNNHRPKGGRPKAAAKPAGESDPETKTEAAGRRGPAHLTSRGVRYAVTKSRI